MIILFQSANVKLPIKWPKKRGSIILCHNHIFASTMNEGVKEVHLFLATLALSPSVDPLS